MSNEQNIDQMPEDNKPDSPPETNSLLADIPIITVTEEQPTNNLQPTTDMEVHHHPDLHHNPKPWKEYFLEYLMIVLAVTTGFFAESLREHLSSTEKEKKYVISYIEDLKKDTAEMRSTLSLQDTIINKMNKALFFKAEDLSDKKNQDSFYHSFVFIYSWVWAFIQNDNTITQLKNAGGFSVFNDKEVVDSITALNQYFEKSVKFNGTFYIDYYHKIVQLSAQFMNMPVIPQNGLDTTDIAESKIFDYNLKLIKQLFSIIRYDKGSLVYYMEKEKHYNTRVSRLISYLKKKYKID